VALEHLANEGGLLQAGGDAGGGGDEAQVAAKSERIALGGELRQMPVIYAVAGAKRNHGHLAAPHRR
jgi:hypothetical protein